MHAHHVPPAGQHHQRDQRERDPERQHHLAEHERVGGVDPLSARITSAGTIVTARRRHRRIRTPMKPAITTWPAYVPTLDDDAPEASSATAKASAAPPPTRRPICRVRALQE